jgi:ABC-type oligopeptide transport system ATPase subunit
MTDPLVFAEGLSKRYDIGDATIQALADVSFSVVAGELLGVVGRSGSGKSTLMSILGLLIGQMPGATISKAARLRISAKMNAPPSGIEKSALCSRWPRCSPAAVPLKMWKCH